MKKAQQDISTETVYSNCLHAILNETYIDSVYYQLFQKQQSDFHYFPKPSKWIAIFDEKYHINKVIFILKYAWSLFGLLFFFLKFNQALFLIAKGRNKANLEDLKNHKKIGFASDQFSETILLEQDVDKLVFFTFGSATINKTNKALVVYYLGYYGLFNVFLLSCLLHFKIGFRDPKLWFQTYMLFDYLSLFSILDKLVDKEIFTTENIDRWAYLFASIGGVHNRVHIIQHGKLANDDQVVFDIPHKLWNVAKIYVYDQASELYFNRYICREPPKEIAIINPTRIRLLKIESNDNVVRVLLIGHPLCQAFHKILSERLLNLGVMIIYKPHPAAESEVRFLKSYPDVKVVNYFPEVDLVISYQSTLADQYEHAGTAVIRHPLDANFGKQSSAIASDLLDTVEQKILAIKENRMRK